MRGLCLMKYPSDMLQNLSYLYISYTKWMPWCHRWTWSISLESLFYQALKTSYISKNDFENLFNFFYSFMNRLCMKSLSSNKSIKKWCPNLDGLAVTQQKLAPLQNWVKLTQVKIWPWDSGHYYKLCLRIMYTGICR